MQSAFLKNLLSKGKASFKEGKVLFLSDLHRGEEKFTAFDAFEPEILSKMAQYEHIVLNGDIFEYFHLSKALEHLAKPMSPVEMEALHSMGEETRHRIEFFTGGKLTEGLQRFAKYLDDKVKEDVRWLEEFLQKNPRCKVHFVMGNHDNLQMLREALDKLQESYHNFEWHPEAIRLGDALITHGDLLIDDTVDEVRAGQLDTANGKVKIRPITRASHVWWDSSWAEIRNMVEGLQWLAREFRGAEKIIPKIYDRLQERSGTGKLFYGQMDYGVVGEHPLNMEGINQVFLGHTHVKFLNHAYKGLTFHNTGSFTRRNAEEADIGLLEANFDGEKVTNVMPVELLTTIQYAKSSNRNAADDVGHLFR